MVVEAPGPLVEQMVEAPRPMVALHYESPMVAEALGLIVEAPGPIHPHLSRPL